MVKLAFSSLPGIFKFHHSVLNGKYRASGAIACVVVATLSVGCASSSPRSTPDDPEKTTESVKKHEEEYEVAKVKKNLIIPDQELKTCPGMRVTNAPSSTERVIDNYAPMVLLQGVELMTAPVKGACLSSGYGKRGSQQRLHKGVDYHQRPAKTVYAAGAGVVLERIFRDDYGNMVLIDHGNGVYTRYAHLANFAAGTEVGASLVMGSELGVMGNSGRPSAVHLHYEILTGDYNNPKRSFGLTARNPFK